MLKDLYVRDYFQDTFIFASCSILKILFLFVCLWCVISRFGIADQIGPGPYLWNVLSAAVRQSGSVAVFKSKLKAHLFGLTFT